MPGEPAGAIAMGDGAPKAGARPSGGSGRGPAREKSVLVAAGEVVGRPLAVWSQKLLDWPKALVAAYRPETQEHLIKFEDPVAMGMSEKWVRLGSTRFQWLREQPEGAEPNPTYAGAPCGDDCVGRRLKVFWPGMGRFYQGKVQSYDAITGRHCIKYRDGDIQELCLHHEAIIWVDVGPLPPRPPSAQQQQQQQQAPGGKPLKPASGAAVGAAAGTSPPAQRQPGGGPAAPSPARAAGAVGATRASSAAAKRPRVDVESSSGDERLRSNKSSATLEGVLATPAGAPATVSPAKDHPAPSEQGGAGGGSGAGGSSNMGSAFSGQSMEGEDEGEERGGSGSSSSEGGSEEEEEEEDGDDGDSSVVTDDLGSEVYSSDLEDEADSDFEVESTRNAGARSSGRRRAGPGGATGAGSGRSGQGRKRSRGSRSRSKRTKKSSAGLPRKSGGTIAAQDRQLKARRDYGRSGSLRPCKQVARVDDEAARTAGGSVVGARVAVLWIHDGQYYKGKLLQFDSYHKRSKILYDDGEEEWISLGRETFKWLAPRGRSAGYAGEMREALAQLAPQLDALPNTTGTQAGVTAGLPVSSPTPLGEVANISVKGAPKGEAAVGWQLSVLFDGDGRWYRGEVLAFDRRKGRHLVLYDDGEDEWLVLEQESLAWHKLARGANALCPGIQPGLPLPRGRAAVGWRVGVFWSADMVFYHGEISAYDAATGRHTVSYDDGEVRTVSLSTDKLKWIVPPGCVVDAAKLAGVEATEALAGAAAAARARPRKGAGIAGESDPDYEFERRAAIRRLPRLLTTASLATADPCGFHQAGHAALLPGEASVAALLQPGHHAASPHWASGAAGLLHRSPGAIFQMPLSPTTEQPLGEPVLVRQLTRVPTLGSFGYSSGESEATQLPAPITVRIYMSGNSGSSGGGGTSGTEAVEAPAGDRSGACSQAPAPASSADGRQRPRGPQARLGYLDQMSRRVVRAQHSLVKGVPTHLPPHPPHQHLAGVAGGPLSPTHHQHRSHPQYGSVGGLHRLARASTADHPLSPTHRRPHPAQSDEEVSSSSGSSDDESDREASPAALLSPRSAAALNGAKVKPEAQQAKHGGACGDPMGLDVDLLLGDGQGMATPCDSGALGPVPPLVRPAPPQLDSPFSAGGLLRSAGGPPPHTMPPLQIYAGKPLFPDGTGEVHGGPALAAGAAPTGTAAAGMARSTSLMGGMLDAIALPPAADPINGLLAMSGPSRHDSEFNLLAMAGPDGDLAPMDGLMDLEVVGVGVGVGVSASVVAGGPGELSGTAALVDPVLPA